MEKKFPPFLTKQLFSLSSSKIASGRFFEIRVAFSEKLDFIESIHNEVKRFLKLYSDFNCNFRNRMLLQNRFQPIVRLIDQAGEWGRTSHL